MRTISMFTMILLALRGGAASAAVEARHVRLEAPVSGRMVVHEIEVYAGILNVAGKNPAATTQGTGYRGVDINERKEGRRLIDGVKNLNERGITLDPGEGVNPWFEIDLGKTIAIDRLVVTQSPGLAYDDRGLRLVTLLDEKRRVVFSHKFDVRDAAAARGEASIEVKESKGALIGRVVPAGAREWAPIGELLDAKDQPEPPDAARRRQSFAARNEPDAIAALGKAFFARMDLSRPQLAAIRRRVESGDWQGALDAWRDRFFEQLARRRFLHEHAIAPRSYGAQAEDLKKNMAVTMGRDTAYAVKFEPGLIDWAYLPGLKTGAGVKSHEASLEPARFRTLVHYAQRSLLSEYREKGDVASLAQWTAISDDWGMHLKSDLARSTDDLRDFFVKEPVQHFNFFCHELAETARLRPAFVKQVPAATLARLLMPVLEEYGPAYWFVCRRTAFNHTFNALNAAYITARVLEDFHAGQQLDRENRRHWERIWSDNITRDGTMIEIGDEGHLDMHLRIGAFYIEMQRDPPDWFTPAFRARFEEGYAAATRYLVRHLTPNGLGHRFGFADQFDRVWKNTETVCEIGGMIPRPTIDNTAIMREPEVRNILQAVYGAALATDRMTPARKTAREKVIAYYGKDFALPQTVSDWMPYAGLHYLRRSWQPDASFMHVLSQAQGHGEANGRNWNTEYRYWDYGYPLLHAQPVTIDGHPQYPDHHRLTYRPGSKTERLTTAPPKPIDARWHTSPRFDLAETIYRGTYQTHSVDRKENRLDERGQPIENVTTQRLIVQVRPARLWLALDRIDWPGESKRTIDARSLLWHPTPDIKTPVKGKVQWDAVNQVVSLANGNTPGLALHHAGLDQVNMKTAENADSDRPRTDLFPHAFVATSATLRGTATGHAAFATLLEPRRRDGDAIIRSIARISDPEKVGFAVELNSGETLIWQAARQGTAALVGNDIDLQGEAMLVWSSGDEVAGLALGARSMKWKGQELKLETTDFEFDVVAGKLANVKPIRRPIAPVIFGPAENVFVDSLDVTMHCDTPGVEIRYTLDGSAPLPTSPLYAGPVTIKSDAFIQARAFRPGIKAIPFTTAGVDVTVPSHARFRRMALLPAITLDESKLQPGLRWELVRDTWFALMSHQPQPHILPAVKKGTTRKLLDVSMREGDGPFGVRYEGYLLLPADGVYTFHAPPEFVGAKAEPGYDLRLYIDGHEWDLGMQEHGRGRWSIPLARGAHHLRVSFVDARHLDRKCHQLGLWRGYPSPWVVWSGEAPVIDVSGSGIPRQAIPQDWLRHHALP